MFVVRRGQRGGDFVVGRGEWGDFFGVERAVGRFIWWGAGSREIFWWGAGSGEIFRWGAGGEWRTAFTFPSKNHFLFKILLNGIFTCKTPLFTISQN